MKFSAIALFASAAAAHYSFDVTIYNGGTSSGNQYIRGSTRPTKYNPIKFSSNPPADIRDGSYIDGPDARCNQGAFSNAGKTNVLSVTAGSKLSVRVAAGAKMGHPGPSLVYMSRAPGDNVKAYDGSGDWFKIYQDGVCNTGSDFTTTAWCSYNKNTITATIPSGVPNGEYLVRFEHIGVHRSHVNQPEHYVGCVQVKVTGGASSGSPGPTVKFPGAYKASDAYANFSIYSGPKTFPFPGPAVWNGSGSGSSSPSPPPSSPAPSSPPPSTKPPSSPPSSPPPSSGCAAMYGQCGGMGFTGPKCCSSGSCKASNEYYSQCM